MDKVVNHPDSNVKDLTFPQGVPWSNGVDRASTVAQLSHFDCGGIALSVCLSHKIGDGSSAHCFLRDWAALTRSSNTIRPSPYFVEDSILSSPIGPLVSPIMGSYMDKCVQKRFIFSSTKLSALKSSIGVQNVTSSEAVSALLYKCAAFSAIAVNSGSFKRSQLIQLSDLREMISPQLPPNPIGNIFSIFSSPIYDKKEELKLSKLVADIKKSKNNLSTRKNVEENELAIEMLDAYRTGESIFHKRKCDVYSSSSLCKFPLLQDLDFGFGKPIRASMAKGPFNKAMFLMRTNDGGIEALVNLNEEEMSVFEHDEHLLQFATPVNYEQQ
ncbi:acyltransferase Pun1-like [Capsicum chacoense]